MLRLVGLLGTENLKYAVWSMALPGKYIVSSATIQVPLGSSKRALRRH